VAGNQCGHNRSRHHRGSQIKLVIRSSLGIVISLLGCCAYADGPVLACRVVQSDKAFDFETGLMQDPYSAPLHDINGRFLFKMVAVGEAESVDYVKIYAYDNSGRQPVLVQYGRYLQPKVPSASQGASLTGIQTVYSAWLEREMQYQCTLVWRAP
jgi:hypothetical protein